MKMHTLVLAVLITIVPLVAFGGSAEVFGDGVRDGTISDAALTNVTGNTEIAVAGSGRIRTLTIGLRSKVKTNQIARAWRVNMGRLHVDGRFKRFRQLERLVHVAYQKATNIMGADAKYFRCVAVTNENWNWRSNHFRVVSQ